MTDKPLSRLGQAALAYAGLGWPVFTCFPKGKRPMDLCPDCDAKLPARDKAGDASCKVCGAVHSGKGGLHFATTDPETVTRWWRKYPDANIGVRCGIPEGKTSGLLVLDVDVPDDGKGADGEVTLAKLLELHGPLPATPHQRTGEYRQEAGAARRGWQYFFSVDVPTHNTAGSLGQVLDENGQPVKGEDGKKITSGIDTRGDGGYVVVAPSVHPSKVHYEWIREPDSRPTKCALAPAPAWLIEALKPQKISEKAAPAPGYKPRPVTGSAKDKWVNAAVEGEYRRMAEAGEGNRNAEINKAAFKLGQLVGGGLLSEADAIATCQAGAEANGWAAEEGAAQVEKVIASGISAGIAKPREGPAERVQLPEREQYQPPATKPALKVVGGQEQPDSGEKKKKPKKEERDEAAPAPLTGWTIEDWSDHCVFKDQTRIFVPKAVKNAIACLLHRAEFADLFLFNKRAQSILVTRMPPWTSNGGPYPRNMRDADIIGFQAATESLGLRLNKASIADAIHFAALQREFDPVLESLNRFEWDKEPRLDHWLETYLGAEGDGRTRNIGPKWLMAAVARILRPGCKFDYMLVLEGKQGLKKSTALRVLAEALAPGVFSDRLSPLKNKDSMIELLGVVIVEVAELAAFKGADSQSIKRFLSAQEDVLRLPWDRTVSTLPRGCVFAGTVNPDGTGYVDDPTGGRRYWPVAVSKIDLDRLTADAPQLWAEARDRYKAGEAIWLDDQAVDDAAAAAVAERIDEDVWAERIETFVTGVDEVRIADVLEHLNITVDHQTRDHKKRVQSHLYRIGWRERHRKHRKTGKTQRVWLRPKKKDLLTEIEPDDRGDDE